MIIVDENMSADVKNSKEGNKSKREREEKRGLKKRRREEKYEETWDSDTKRIRCKVKEVGHTRQKGKRKEKEKVNKLVGWLRYVAILTFIKITSTTSPPSTHRFPCTSQQPNHTHLGRISRTRLQSRKRTFVGVVDLVIGYHSEGMMDW